MRPRVASYILNPCRIFCRAASSSGGDASEDAEAEGEEAAEAAEGEELVPLEITFRDAMAVGALEQGRTKGGEERAARGTDTEHSDENNGWSQHRALGVSCTVATISSCLLPSHSDTVDVDAPPSVHPTRFCRSPHCPRSVCVVMGE